MANYYKCPVCGKKYRNLPNLKKHFNKTHELKYCYICKAWFRSLVSHAMIQYINHGCEDHGVLWYLLINAKKCKSKTKWELFEIVEKKLGVD